MTWNRTHAKKHEWGALTRTEIAEARDNGAFPVLTVGSCEQHTDHFPVDADGTGATYAALFPAGDPAVATLKAGKVLLEATVAGLARFLAVFGQARLKVGQPP